MTDKDVWDKVLTDAICENDGSVQPYDKMLAFLSARYELRVKRDRRTGKELKDRKPTTPTQG